MLALMPRVQAGPADRPRPELAAGAPAEVRRHQGLLRRLRPHLSRAACCTRQLTERGRLLVKKPGKMRWDYTAPETKLFVSDGVKMYSYIPQDKQVIVSAVPPDDKATTPTLFLAGKGNLTRDFTPSLADAPAGVARRAAAALKLVPKSAPAGLRLAGARRRPGDPRPPGPGDGRRAGRHIELFLHESEGKRRYWPIRSSPSRFLAVLMLLPIHRSADSRHAGRRAPSRAGACRALALCCRRPAAPRRRPAPRRATAEERAGLRPRRRRIHQGASARTPTTPNARLGARARQAARRRSDHFQRGRRLAATGKFDQALVEYELAAELNPTSGDIDDGAARRRATSCAPRSRSRAKARPSSQTLIERTRDLPPPGLDLPPDVKMPASLIFRDASSRDVFPAIARFANISLGVRPDVPRGAGHRRPAQRDARATRSSTVAGADAHVLPRHRAANRPRHSRHAGQAPRVRGRGRPDVLPEQRRSQGDDGSAAPGARRAAHLADDRRPTR